MIVEHPKVAFQDERGAITDLLQDVEIESVTLITSRAGAVRGNHYHKETIQYTYVLKGKVCAYTQDGEDAEIQSRMLVPGDLLTSPANERHALKAIEDSTLLILTRGPRSGTSYEDDTFRIPSIVK